MPKRTKCCQTSSRGLVVLLIRWLPHAYQLEYEIRQSREEDENNAPHYPSLLPSGAPGCKDQEGDGNWEGSDCDIKLVILSTDSIARAGGKSSGGCYNNDELDRESDKEEKVKLQECNENLFNLVNSC
jgi:hypothetical protein